MTRGELALLDRKQIGGDGAGPRGGDHFFGDGDGGGDDGDGGDDDDDPIPDAGAHSDPAATLEAANRCGVLPLSFAAGIHLHREGSATRAVVRKALA